MKDKAKPLTKAEEQIMHILWKLKSAYVREILSEFPLPRPAYNTVSTIVRILEKKGFVGHRTKGKSHKYHPRISKEEYRKSQFGNFVKNYFENSYKSLTSFFAKEENLSIEDLEEIKNLIEDEINKKKSSKK